MPGAGEIALVFIIALVLFGPDKLPELARGLGKAVREVRKITGEFHNQINLMGDDDSNRRPVYHDEPASVVTTDHNTASFESTPYETGNANVAEPTQQQLPLELDSTPADNPSETAVVAPVEQNGLYRTVEPGTTVARQMGIAAPQADLSKIEQPPATE